MLLKSIPNELNGTSDWEEYIGEPVEIKAPRFWFIALLKVLIGQGNVFDGSICWVRQKFGRLMDFHDFEYHKGGDGYPTVMYHHTCLKCGKTFTI